MTDETTTSKEKTDGEKMFGYGESEGKGAFNPRYDKGDEAVEVIMEKLRERGLTVTKDPRGRRPREEIDPDNVDEYAETEFDIRVHFDDGESTTIESHRWSSASCPDNTPAGWSYPACIIDTTKKYDKKQEKPMFVVEVAGKDEGMMAVPVWLTREKWTTAFGRDEDRGQRPFNYWCETKYCMSFEEMCAALITECAVHRVRAAIVADD